MNDSGELVAIVLILAVAILVVLVTIELSRPNKIEVARIQAQRQSVIALGEAIETARHIRTSIKDFSVKKEDDQ